MSMSDPIADMFTRIRNGQHARKKQVSMPASKMKSAIAQVLKNEGYIDSFEVSEADPVKPTLNVKLRYYQGRGVIDRIDRVSRPGLRIYREKNDLPRVLNGLGVTIVSTSKGIMSDRAARQAGCGGEVICMVA